MKHKILINAEQLSQLIAWSQSHIKHLAAQKLNTNDETLLRYYTEKIKETEMLINSINEQYSHGFN